MLRLLVVDDEAMHRRNLTHLLGSIYPEHVLLEASDGLQALEEVSRSPIDIVITDIRMPNMDGLELLSVLQRDFPQVKVVILSVYSEFSYAQQALQSGAMDYVLKPIRVSELKETLDKVIKLIYQEHADKQRTVEIEQQLDETLPVYIDHILNNLLLGRANGEESELLDGLGLFGEGHVLLCELRPQGLDAFSSSRLPELKAIVHQSFSPLSSIASQIEMEPFLVAILVLGREDIRLSAERLILSVKRDLNITASVSIGSYQENLRLSASVSYRHAQAAHEFCFYGGDVPILYEEIMSKEHPSHIDNTKWETSWKMLVSSFAYEKIDQTVEALRAMILSERNRLYYPNVVKQKVAQSMQNVLRHYEHTVSGDNRQELAGYIDNFIFKAPTLPVFLESCKVFFERLMTNVEEERKQGSDDRIDSICTYIAHNYRDDLTLDVMADQFYLNRSYFSTIFKNSTGKSFTEYLTDVRMQKAKDLLLHSNAKIHRIAELVGYNDASYFARAFRRNYGVTPDEYRRLHAHKAGIHNDE